MPVGLFVYTANMKRLTPLLLTVIIAGIAGFYVATYQQKSLATTLLASPTVTDQLRGMTLLEQSSFDELQELLVSIVPTGTDSAKVAQQLLVQRAFQEGRIHDLQEVGLDRDLYEAAMWWNSEFQTPKEIGIDIHMNPSPWVLKLSVWYPNTHSPATYPDLIQLPVRDRDGSVLLSVLAIHQFGSEKTEALIQAWEKDYDLERQKASALLSALHELPQPKISLQDEALVTIQAIITEGDFQLAWRTLHRTDGSIDPDVALAAMIVDQKRFLPILIDSAKQNLWTHPEHAIIIAKAFCGEVANQIPFSLLENKDSRQKWWSLFACGLLQEER
jgi:hypothetical protein